MNFWINIFDHISLMNLGIFPRIFVMSTKCFIYSLPVHFRLVSSMSDFVFCHNFMQNNIIIWKMPHPNGAVKIKRKMWLLFNSHEIYMDVLPLLCRFRRDFPWNRSRVIDTLFHKIKWLPVNPLFDCFVFLLWYPFQMMSFLDWNLEFVI